MNRREFLEVGAAATLGLAVPGVLRAADDPDTLKVLAKYQKNIDRGLNWLAKNQFKDGHWEGQGGTYPIAMTALSGLALLAEGSTPHQGKYAKEIDNCVEFLMARTQKSGLIGNPADQREQQQYMYGHGFSLLFLSQVYGEENDEKRRTRLEKSLARAVEFSGKAQTRLGGWGYISATESGDFDEGSVTITQMQAIRAARGAGIPVPKQIVDKGIEYLKKSTVITAKHPDPKKEEGGVIYSLRNGGGGVRPPLTAAGIACSFSAGEYDSETALKWLNYCQKHIPFSRGGGGDLVGHWWEYTHFYYAQVLYCLGEDRHAKLRPDLADKDLLKWSKYRSAIFDNICSRQSGDGSWQGNYGGVYNTAMYLVILQLDKACLPILAR